MTVEAAIYARLTTFDGLVDLLGSPPEVYSGHLPQGGAVTEGVYFFRVSDIEHVRAMGNDTGLVRARFQVNSVAARMDEARALAEQVRQALQRYNCTTPAVIQDIYALNGSEFYLPNESRYSVDRDYEVVYIEDLEA